MIPDMAGEERQDVVIDLPNRHKASSQATRWIVVLLLLVSAGMMAFVLIGGWDALNGANSVVVGYIVVYLLLAFFCARWTRGTLPVAAALAIILLIFAAIAGSVNPVLSRSNHAGVATAAKMAMMIARAAMTGRTPRFQRPT
jgi:uncharacterized membrane protein YjjP (DUF1212 family)